MIIHDLSQSSGDTTNGSTHIIAICIFDHRTLQIERCKLTPFRLDKWGYVFVNRYTYYWRRNRLCYLTIGSKHFLKRW